MTLACSATLVVTIGLAGSGSASAVPIPNGINCNYGFYAMNYITFLGNSIYNQQRQVDNLKEKYTVNTSAYPAYTYGHSNWGYGFRYVTSTGYRGGSFVSVDFANVECV